MQRYSFFGIETGAEHNWPTLVAALHRIGAVNCSVWQAEAYIFGYYELANTDVADMAGDLVRNTVQGLWASPGNLRLMYEALGTPRSDKSMIRRTAFFTRLKPNCADQYAERHQRLREMRAAHPQADGPENNFTVWNVGDYICGYREMDRSYSPDHSEAARQRSAVWEKQMLKLMDWITDDTDWIFGTTHSAARCLYEDE